MAEDGALELLESHCAIAQAANFCKQFCGGELAVTNRTGHCSSQLTFGNRTLNDSGIATTWPVL